MRRWMIVAVLAAATVTSCSPHDAEPPTPAAAGRQAAASAEAPARLECDHRAEQATAEQRTQGAPAVPAGAVAARLCGGQVDNAGFDLVWPADTLHDRDVAHLVRLLNRLEPFEQPEMCTLPASPGFDLVLAYPGGGRVWLRGDTSGSCAHIDVQGGRAWTGASRVLHAVLTLIRSHRAIAEPHVRDTAPRCPQTWNGVSYTAGAASVRPPARVTVTACRYRLRLEPGKITQSADGRLVTQARILHPSALVRALAGGSRRDPCDGHDYDLRRTQDVLLVQDRYGDRQAVSTTACWASRLTGHLRYPRAALTYRVAALLSPAG